MPKVYRSGIPRHQISTTNAVGIMSDLIAKDLNNEQIAKKWGINHQTVANINNAFLTKIEETKSKIVNDVMSRLPENLNIITDKLVKLGQNAFDLALQPEKLEKSSSLQLATIGAICVDKIQLLSGGATAIVQHQHFKKSDMLSKLNDTIIDISPTDTQKNGESSKIISEKVQSSTFESPTKSQEFDLNGTRPLPKVKKATDKSVSKEIKAIKSELAKVLDNGVLDKTANSTGEKI